ncbi:hypothetical protein SUGI_0639970 [Cryptomeria japonica]|nr:hypothetical protein SUGI_0639970 [Cryptomeria japonica]
MPLGFTFIINGSLHLLGNLPHQNLAALAKRYRSIVFLRLGSVSTVVICYPAMAKEFLKSHDLVFATRPNCTFGKHVSYDHKDVAFASYGAYRRWSRKLLDGGAAHSKEKPVFQICKRRRSVCHDRLRLAGKRARTQYVDVKKKLSSLNQNIVCRMFASRTYSDNDLIGELGFKKMVEEMFTVAGAFCICDFIPSLDWLDWLDLLGFRGRMQAVHKIFDEFAGKLIDAHILHNGKRNKDRVKDLVDVLLNKAQTESHTITGTRIKAMVLPDEMCAEDVKWGNGNIGDIDSEIFRLHPPFPLLIPHESTEGCSVGGYFILPRTPLYVNVWAMGRDESVWKDAHMFKPKQFMGCNKDVRGQDFDLLPFGTGRRGCPGISMGLSVSELALAQLIHCFDLNVESKVDVAKEFGITVPRKNPLIACPKWRLGTEDPS